MISEDLNYIIEIFVFLAFFNGSIFVLYSLYKYYNEKKKEKWAKDHPNVILPD